MSKSDMVVSTLESQILKENTLNKKDAIKVNMKKQIQESLRRLKPNIQRRKYGRPSPIYDDEEKYIKIED